MEHERETQRASAVLWSLRGAHLGTHIRGEDRQTDRRVDVFWQTDSWSKTPPHLSARCLLSLHTPPLCIFELGPSLTICWLTGSGTRGVDGSEEKKWRKERGEMEGENKMGTWVKGMFSYQHWGNKHLPRSFKWGKRGCHNSRANSETIGKVGCAHNEMQECKRLEVW